MIDWKETALIAPPKDRLILATSGWCWQREDDHKPETIIKRTGGIIPARYTKKRSLRGAVVMLYWLVDGGSGFLKREEGGCWVLAGRDVAWFEPFKWWAEVNNPLTAEAAHTEEPTLVITNEVPDVDTMPVYVPSEDVLKTRRLRAAIGL